ncbi:MAG: N-acetyltransferase [Bacteroidales bacterium]|nr:N-acetyltransferase [Bacteroidales bacterium]
MSIQIYEIQNRKDLNKFISFQFELYKNNPYWCPPLFKSEMDTLQWGSPSFDFCQARYFMAYRNNKIVGRVAAIVNHKANEIWNEQRIRFGWIDFIDDLEVSAALISQVEQWGKELGLNEIHGPLGFTDMDNEGMLIEGFNEMSNVFSIYNYPYYVTHMEKLGFRKDADWVQNIFTIPKEIHPLVSRIAQIAKEKHQLRVLSVTSKKELLLYGKKMFHTLNNCFRQLYGFVPLSERQIQSYIDQYFGFVNPQFIALVLNPRNDVVAFGISMPSLTKALQKANGKIFPWGWWHLLKALNEREIIEMYLVGTLPEYQTKGAIALVFEHLMNAYIRAGFKYAISGPQLEENIKALSIWKHFEHRQHLVRRCWVKNIE